jgi:hypothetical protein
MRGPHWAGIGLLLAALAAGGCTAANFPVLPALPSIAQTGGGVQAQPGPYETSWVVAGTPTVVFAQVARGALGCWFAADGPLKASHVYRAEADPPAKGGTAEIGVFERDSSTRDQRGPRAYRVAMTTEGSGVRVAATALKFDQALAQAMARDVESWAKGESGCQLRALLPPPAPPTPVRTAKRPGTSKKR